MAAGETESLGRTEVSTKSLAGFPVEGHVHATQETFIATSFGLLSREVGDKLTKPACSCTASELSHVFRGERSQSLGDTMYQSLDTASQQPADISLTGDMLWIKRC